MYKRQYKKGKQITSLDELYKQEFIFDRDQILHRGWFGSWQFRFAHNRMLRGYLHYAIKVGDENLNGK